MGYEVLKCGFLPEQDCLMADCPLSAWVEDESSEDEGRKKSFYFKYFLDKLTNPEFVDYRALFHRLDSEYRAGSDYKAGLKRIYKEYEDFKLIIELRGAKKKLESEEPVRKYVWNPIIKKMESEVESTKEAG